MVDFINSENTKSNSKHSLFDHFKRNLFLNCTIPRFDPRNGLLGLKSALDMNGRSCSGVTVTGVYSNGVGGDEISHSINRENSPCYPSESSRISILISVIRNIFVLLNISEKRKLQKLNEIDHQQKTILVPSISCK